jgi:CMP-N,N'-diacetyllegionaminic acid synthase
MRQDDFKKVCVIIPARKGSKGIPGKNKKLFFGRPLIEWSIKISKKLPIQLCNIFVTTDDKDIISIAKGENVSYITRSSDISNDSTPMVKVIEHALKFVPEDIKEIILLQPTSPLRTKDDIINALLKFKSGNYESLISGYKVDNVHPSKMYIFENDLLIPVAENLSQPNRQELKEIFHRNGAIFIFSRDYFEKNKKVWGGKMTLFEMPFARSIDIDDIDDFILAENIFKKL